MIQAVSIYVRILRLLSDNFGTDVPDERVRGCIEIAGSVDAYENALRFLESKKLIDVVSGCNPRTGERINYPILEGKAHRLVRLLGAEALLLEQKKFKW